MERLQSGPKVLKKIIKNLSYTSEKVKLKQEFLSSTKKDYKKEAVS